jgi:hypothetical protein
MITCPWCGTSYISFQSNCGKCGGPIPPLPKETVTEPELIPPPMAPRPFADNYAWKLVFSDGWAVASLVFVLLGGIFTIVGIPLTLGIITAFVGLPFTGMGILFLAAGGIIFNNSLQKARVTVNVLREGQAVIGKIENVEMNYNIRVNNRNPWIIQYSYQVNGTDYEGQISTLNQPGPLLQTNRSAYVLYLPDAPQNNSLYPHP